MNFEIGCSTIKKWDVGCRSQVRFPKLLGFSWGNNYALWRAAHQSNLCEGWIFGGLQISQLQGRVGELGNIMNKIWNRKGIWFGFTHFWNRLVIS